MREIKFRAWAKRWGSEEWEMIHEVGLFPVSCTCPFSISSDGIFVNPTYADAILEQYTGLNDKNGREIYEGDIASPWGRPAVMKYFPNLGRFKWARRVNEENEFVYNPESCCEVLGNIHENPELLGAMESHADE